MSDVRVALEKILGEASAFSEGSPQSDAFFRIQGLAQRALSEVWADAALVAPREPLQHLRNAEDICSPECYACERAGLIARVKFTEDYESLKYQLSESAALVAGLRQALADLTVEHQCCLDGDTAWAEKWKAKYEAVLAGLRGLIAQWRQHAKDSEDAAQKHAQDQFLCGEAETFDKCADALAQALAGRTETP